MHFWIWKEGLILDFNIPKNILEEFKTVHDNKKILYYECMGTGDICIHEIYFKDDCLIGIFSIGSREESTTYLTKHNIEILSKIKKDLQE